jgi:signal recognition particle subunit SEC65
LSRVVGLKKKMLTDGELRAWLDTHYVRITIHEACAQTREQAAPNLAVFVRGQQGWSQLDKSQVEDMWLAHTRSRSFCHFISRDLLKLSAAEYANVKRNLENVKSDGLAGIYKAKKSKAKPLEPYAVVLEFPESSALYRNLLIAGGSLLGAATVGGVMIKNSRDKKQATQLTLAQLAQNEGLIGVIANKQKEIKELDKILEKKQGELQNLESQRSRLDRELSIRRAENASLQEENGRISTHELDLQSAQHNFQSKLEETRLLEVQRQGLETTVASLRAEKENLNVELAALTEDIKLKAEYKTELEGDLDSLDLRIQGREEFLSFDDNLANKRERLRNVDQNVAILNSQREELEEQVSALTLKVFELEARKPKQDKELQEYRQLGEIDPLREMQDENARFKDVNTELQKFRQLFQVHSFDEMKQFVDTLEDSIISARDVLVCEELYTKYNAVYFQFIRHHPEYIMKLISECTDMKDYEQKLKAGLAKSQTFKLRPCKGIP